MKVKKAIIPVAGWGTRRLPITKTIEKAMLPIGNRPLVDYVVEDLFSGPFVYPPSFLFCFFENQSDVRSSLVYSECAALCSGSDALKDGTRSNVASCNIKTRNIHIFIFRICHS